MHLSDGNFSHFNFVALSKKNYNMKICENYFFFVNSSLSTNANLLLLWVGRKVIDIIIIKSRAVIIYNRN